MPIVSLIIGFIVFFFCFFVSKKERGKTNKIRVSISYAAEWNAKGKNIVMKSRAKNQLKNKKRQQHAIWITSASISSPKIFTSKIKSGTKSSIRYKMCGANGTRLSHNSYKYTCPLALGRAHQKTSDCAHVERFDVCIYMVMVSALVYI